MATAFGSAAARLPAKFPAPAGLAALRKTTRLRCAPAQTGFASQKRTRRSICALGRARAALGRKTVHRGRLGFIRAATRPCAALQVRCRRASGGAPLPLLQSCARAGCGASQAQAPAAGDTATQPGLRKRAQSASSRAYVSGSQNLFEPEQSEGELFCAGSRGRPAQGIRWSRAAAVSNAVAIAPQPAHAQLCREVMARSRQARDANLRGNSLDWRGLNHVCTAKNSVNRP